MDGRVSRLEFRIISYEGIERTVRTENEVVLTKSISG